MTLDHLAQPFRDAKDALVGLTDGLSHEAFNRKPSPKAWSAGECVVHLNTVSGGYLPVFEDLIARGGPAGEPPFRYGWVARQFIAAVTPGSRPIPTMGSMKPPASQPATSEIDLDHAVSQFVEVTSRCVAVVEAAEGLDLAAIRMRSPFMPVMRLPLGAFLEATGQHHLRHVQQAERAVARAR